MPLSPEERHRIYLEEQARLEAIEELSEGKKSKKSGCLTWGLVVVIGLIVIANLTNQKSTEVSRPNPLELLDLDFQWRKAGFDNVMIGDFTIHNKNAFDVKDIEITCTHFGKSGTQIDSNRKTLYETVKAKSKKVVRNFSMGFIHTQANSTSCRLTSASWL